MLSINARDARPIYEQVRDEMRKLIVSGAIASDEKLPSVRELAAELAINPNTIQRAYRELESMGVIYTVAGKGAFASSREGAVALRRNELMGQLEELLEELRLVDADPDEIEVLVQKALKGGNDDD